MSAYRFAAALALASLAANGQALLDDAETPAGPLTEAVTPVVLALHDATPVRLRLTRDLTFTNINPGEKVNFEILDDLRIAGVLVMAHGGRAVATITEAEPKTRMGRGGKLGVDLSSLPLLNGGTVPIRPEKEGKSAPETGGRAAAGEGLVKPATPALLLTIGKKDALPEGTSLTAYIDGEIQLDPTRFLVDITFTSSPPGAGVSMYGSLIGRTPFTTRLAPGTYQTIFSAAGYPDLAQSVSVGPGRASTVHAAFAAKP